MVIVRSAMRPAKNSEEEAAAMDRKIKRREYGIEDDVKTKE